jgi:circadian clock protein KaiC
MIRSISKMATGISGLDRLLEGGIVRGNSLLIEGAPGSGKTTFGVRMIAEGVQRYGEPGLVISFEEFPRQIYEEALTHGIDLAALEATGKLRVIWTPPQRVLESFSGRNELIEGLIEQLGVRRLLIDSITHFKRVAREETQLRESLSAMLNYLKIHDINSILIKELESQDENHIAFEEYLVDASMRVLNTSSEVGGENVRLVEVRKTRGQGHISGRHPFVLSSEGLDVFPRLRPTDVRFGLRSAFDTSRARVSSGNAALDEMLCGGFWEGSVNLVSGYQGTGKSVLTFEFIEAALKRGSMCVYASFHSPPEDIMGAAATLGLNWSEALANGRLHLLRFDWTGLTPEIFTNHLFKEFENHPPEAFVLDSVNDIDLLPRRGQRAHDDVMVLQEMLRSVGATSILLHRSKQIGNTSDETESELAQLADTIVLLVMAESEGKLQRFLGIRKHRGSDHAKDLREIEIDARGLHIATHRTRQTGVLSGSAQRGFEDPAVEVVPRIETVLAAFREVLSEGRLGNDDAEKLVSARAELSIVDAVLREHFGITAFHEFVEQNKR